MILSVFSLLFFEHAAFAKSNSADQNMSEYIVSMIDNEKLECVPESAEKAKAADSSGWSQCEGVKIN